MFTSFHESRITVSKPDKLRVDFESEFQEISLYYNKRQAVLFMPAKNLYADLSLPEKTTVVVTSPGMALYSCNNVYYRPFYQGTTLVYQVVQYP